MTDGKTKEISNADIARLLFPLMEKEDIHSTLTARVRSEFDVNVDNARAIIEHISAQGYLQGYGINGRQGFYGALPYRYTITEKGKQLIKETL